MRDVSSARISRRALPDGRLEQVIQHAVLPGMTPELMLWWFSVIDRTVEFRGIRCLAYRLWHPRDHIHFEVRGRAADGTVGPGARFRIVEAFGGRPEFLLDEVFRVARLDRTGIRIEIRKAGAVFAALDEDWEPVEGGLRYAVTMRIGASGALRVLNPVIHWRRRAALEAWLTHNVEEVGNLPLFLPELRASLDDRTGEACALSASGEQRH